MAANELGPMLTASEVANMLHLHVNTVKRLGDRGELPFYRVCKRGDRRFRLDDVMSVPRQEPLTADSRSPEARHPDRVPRPGNCMKPASTAAGFNDSSERVAGYALARGSEPRAAAKRSRPVEISSAVTSIGGRNRITLW